ncbi:MAG: L,D-transpeptidase [Desulfomonilaceae bacterium]
MAVNGRSMPGSLKALLQEALPAPSIAAALSKPQSGWTQGPTETGAERPPDFRQASVSPTPQKERAQENLMSGELIPYLEIEVKHGEHTFTLLAHTEDGSMKTLYHCRVGLGGPEFPTPVGTYYVTHIYDEEPWWIPPKDRAWAAGEKPSKKVYGGTMAPLLKKRDIREKKRTPSSEDMIAGRVKLEDYGYRFHGTNAPRSIGRNQSHGCVRMLPADAKKVAELIKEQVGITDRRESENGSYVVLKRPVRLNLVK